MTWVFTEYGLLQLMLVFVRTTGMVLTMPVLGHSGIPAPLKVAISALITFLIAHVIGQEEVFDVITPYFLQVIQELIIGVVIGFSANLIFEALKIAGEIGDLGMGFHMNQIVDSSTMSRVSLSSHFFWAIGIFIFAVLEGHLWLIRLYARSYDLLPIGESIFVGPLQHYLIEAVGKMFVLGIQIGLPIVGATFLIDVAMGVLTRSVPQVNVFFFGFPIKILVGIATMFMLMTNYFDYVVVSLFDVMKEDLIALINSLRG